MTVGSQLPTPEILDSLTGLATRDYFDRRLAAAIERTRQPGTPCFAVMFLDLDDFKPINDQHGHATGDRVLTAIAERLSAAIRPGDLLSRRGGDEFTLLLEGIHHADEARHVAERLWRQSQTPLKVDGRALQVGMSIGIAYGDGSITDPQRIIAAADQAMYAAKRRGAPTMHGD
jgi:diguanylate cyclase (GGDEF)-like protein